MPVNLPTSLLRSFVAIVDTGSMLNASERVFVTQSALSLQIKKLEEMVQQSLFLRDGRRLALTPPGTVLLDYARRVLNLHDEAVSAVSAGNFDGPVRIGMVQDFAETLFTRVLSRFASLHPESQVYARVAGTVELKAMLDRGELDIVVGYGSIGDAATVTVAPMVWYGEGRLIDQAVVPLAVLEKPCRFREAAINALDAAGVRWRIAIETPNLTTVRAAVEAGLGITARTELFLPTGPSLSADALPALPGIACIVSRAANLSDPTVRLAELAAEVVRERPAT